MLPIYLIIGLINIFAQQHNYGTKINNPEYDIRLRRSVKNNALDSEEMFNNNNDNIENNKNYILRQKRHAYYTKLTNNEDLPRFNFTKPKYNNTTINNNKYTIFNSTWNYLFGLKTSNSNNRNSSGVNGNYYPGHISVTNTTYNRNHGFPGSYNMNRTIIRSYPYGYPPGYGPKANNSGYRTVIPGYNAIAPATPGYSNANNSANNTPYYYNYQYPNGQNFGGYYGYNGSGLYYNNGTPEYSNFNNVPVPYSPGYTPVNNTGYNNNNITLWSNIFAPYPPGYSPKPANKTYNNVPAPYAPNYGPNPDMQAEYIPGYNNFNNIPAPYAIKPVNNTGIYNILAPYPVYSSKNTGYFTNNTTTLGYNNFNNTPRPYAQDPVNNSTTPGNNTTVTTTEIIVTSCVICNIPCPKFMKRFGSLCIREDADDEY